MAANASHLVTLAIYPGRATTGKIGTAVVPSISEWTPGKTASEQECIVDFPGPWKVDTEADWVDLAVSAQDRFNMAVLENTTGAERTATVTITTQGGATADVTITQAGE